MKKIKRVPFRFILAFVLIAWMQSLPAQEKLAQTGMQFLSVIQDARSAALAGAMTTVANYSGGLFSNPAMLTGNEYQFDVMLSQNNWIADIKHNAFSTAYMPEGGLYGVFALSALIVDYGEIEGTMIAENELGYLETGLISPTAYALGVGYAKSLSARFSVGAHVKYVSQNLGPAVAAVNTNPDKMTMVNNDLSVLAFDFGTVYNTGFKSLVFGMSIQNFSQEIKYVEESFQLPLTFNIGVSMNLAQLLPENYQSQHILFSIDAVHPRSHSELVKFGIEYKYIDFLALRIGYLSNTDEQDFTFGVGVQQFGFAFDYAYTPFGVFEKVQRFTLRFSM
jgi:hypothetical protein